MSKLIIYYSFSGKTRKIAKNPAKQESSEDIEKWALPVAASRLAECIETEVDYLMGIVSEKLKVIYEH